MIAPLVRLSQSAEYRDNYIVLYKAMYCGVDFVIQKLNIKEKITVSTEDYHVIITQF